ncbi:hypothetical protein K2Z84_32750, partial [Candidatus Binatia bacterium]|nr:hypothetical protein [Candidatus Binatia bacterium]
ATAAARARAATQAGALVVVVPAHEMLPFAWHFSPESFRDLDHLAARLRDLDVIGVARIADVAELATLPRELVLIVAQPLGASVDALAPLLAAAQRDPWQREDLPALVVLRSPAPASAPAPAP